MLCIGYGLCECIRARSRNGDTRVTKIERIMGQLNFETSEKKATAILKVAVYQLTVPFANVHIPLMHELVFIE